MAHAAARHSYATIRGTSTVRNYHKTLVAESPVGLQRIYLTVLAHIMQNDSWAVQLDILYHGTDDATE